MHLFQLVSHFPRHVRHAPRNPLVDGVKRLQPRVVVIGQLLPQLFRRPAQLLSQRLPAGLEFSQQVARLGRQLSDVLDIVVAHLGDPLVHFVERVETRGLATGRQFAESVRCPP